VRLFTAIELGADVAAQAGALVDDLRRRTAKLAPAARVTWVAADRIHLTLRFIGEVEEQQAAQVVHALRDPVRTAPFPVRWGAPGAFPPRGAPRVLWLGIERGARDLEALEAEVSGRLRAIGIPPEDRPYHPHLTLARVREPAGLRTAALFDGLHPRLGETTVDAITLFESRLSPKGPAYTTLLKTPLRP
jgi:2'-5' RNA ligase